MISCLCVTEDRPAFMPWVLWCFERQTWSSKELVVIDSSAEPFRFMDRDDCRVVAAPPGAGVAIKRNLAVREARGEIVTWFDDDDWQHPAKLDWLAEALEGGAAYTGARRSWFLDLDESRCAPFRAPGGRILFNSAGFRRAAVLSVRFPEDMVRASDTPWMRDISRRYRGAGVTLEEEAMFFWLCHGKNLSNPVGRRDFPHRLDRLRGAVGPEAWGDTDEALGALRKRVAPMNHVRSGASVRRRDMAPPRSSGGAPDAPGQGSNNRAGEAETPPVGGMIKATVMDAPFLEVMVRHMISAANHPFVEKVIIVERDADFTGKYRDRPRSSREEFARILDRLLKDGVVDRVRNVDASPAAVREVMETYIEKDASGVPLHSITGGPIYTTLFGLESMAVDHVLQMDADIFFHTGAESWIGQALARMARDPRLWLMMTHPGPPAGPPGKSLGPMNARLGTWAPGWASGGSPARRLAISCATGESCGIGCGPNSWEEGAFHWNT